MSRDSHHPALADLGARLTRAGFRLYANQQNLLFDGYQLAYLSENQPDRETAAEAGHPSDRRA